MTSTSIAAAVSENALLTMVRQAATLLGFLCYHTYDSQRSPAGFPDLVLCGHGHVLFIELKSARGRLSQAQRQWLEALQRVQHPPYTAVWHPADLDRVLAFLQHLAQEDREGTEDCGAPPSLQA